MSEQLTHINTRNETRNRSLRGSMNILKSQDNLSGGLQDFNIHNNNLDGRQNDRKNIPENTIQYHSQRIMQSSHHQLSFQPGKSLNNFWKNQKERLETVECIYSQKPMNLESNFKSIPSGKQKSRVIPGTAQCSDNTQRPKIGQKISINDLKTVPLENLIKLNLKELLNQDSKCEIQSINNSNSYNFQTNKVRASHSADDGCGRFEESTQNMLNIDKETQHKESEREDNKLKIKTKQQTALYYPPLWKNTNHAKQYPFTFLSKFSSNNTQNQDNIVNRNEQIKTMPTQSTTESRNGSIYQHPLSLTRTEEIIPQELKSKQASLIHQEELQKMNSTSQNNQKIVKEGDYSKEILPLNKFTNNHFFSTSRLPSNRNANVKQQLISRQKGGTQQNRFFNNSKGINNSCEIKSDQMLLDHRKKEDKKYDNCQSCQTLQDETKQWNDNLKIKQLDSSSADCIENMERTQHKIHLYHKTKSQIDITSQQQQKQLRQSNCESQDIGSSMKSTNTVQEIQSCEGTIEIKGSSEIQNSENHMSNLAQQQQNKSLQKKNMAELPPRSMTPRIISGINIQSDRSGSFNRNSSQNIKQNEIVQDCQQIIGQTNQQNENIQDSKETLEVIPLIKSMECVMSNRPNTSQCKTRRRMEVKQQTIQSREYQTITESNQDELQIDILYSSQEFKQNTKNDQDRILKTHRNTKKRFSSMDQILQFTDDNNNYNNDKCLKENNQQNQEVEQQIAQKMIEKEENNMIVKQTQDNDKQKQKQQKNPFLIKIQRALLKKSTTTEDNNSSVAQQNLRKPQGTNLHSDFLSLFSQQ